jgi:hypothetical protein
MAPQVRDKAWERVELACAEAQARGFLSEIHMRSQQHAADLRVLLGLDRRAARLEVKAEQRRKAKFHANQARLDAAERDRGAAHQHRGRGRLP